MNTIKLKRSFSEPITHVLPLFYLLNGGLYGSKVQKHVCVRSPI